MKRGRCSFSVYLNPSALGTINSRHVNGIHAWVNMVRRQYSLRVAFLVVSCLCVAFWLVSMMGEGQPVIYGHEMTKVATDGKKWRISYGADEAGHLVFAVFLDSPDPKITYFSGRHLKYAVIKCSGSELRVPGKQQLYECIANQLRTSDFSVTGDEFRAFLDSSQRRFDIHALLVFVGEYRRRVASQGKAGKAGESGRSDP